MRYCPDVQNHDRQTGINLNGFSGLEYDTVIAYDGPGVGEL